jgi:hypothetical protein
MWLARWLLPRDGLRVAQLGDRALRLTAPELICLQPGAPREIHTGGGGSAHPAQRARPNAYSRGTAIPEREGRAGGSDAGRWSRGRMHLTLEPMCLRAEQGGEGGSNTGGGGKDAGWRC